MSAQPQPLHVCQDLRSLVVLRSIRILQRYTNDRPNARVFEELAQAMMVDYIQDEGNTDASLSNLIERLENDEDSHFRYPSSESDTVLLDYWEALFAPKLHAHLKQWVLFNGLRSVTGEEFKAFFMPLLNEPEHLGIVFVATYKEQTSVTLVELHQAKEKAKLRHERREIEPWRMRRSVSNIVTKDQWRALGFNECMSYHEVDAVLARWVIEMEEVFDDPDLPASHIASFFRQCLKVLETQCPSSIRDLGQHFFVKKLGGPQALWRKLRHTYTDDYLLASIRAYTSRQIIVDHVMSRVTLHRDFAKTLWGVFWDRKEPTIAQIDSDIKMATQTFGPQLFQ